MKDARTPSPTPWHAGDSAIAGNDGATVAYVTNDAEGRRIVSCVNALDGIEDPAATLAEVRAVLAAIAQHGAGAPALEARRALSLLTPMDPR